MESDRYFGDFCIIKAIYEYKHQEEPSKSKLIAETRNNKT